MAAGGTGLDHELAVAIRLAREAGELIRRVQARGLTVERKAGNEPVTAADREASALWLAGLADAFPSDALLSEEAPDDGTRHARERVWMVDPIDGTNDFIHGHEGFATMAGLLVGDRPALGVVYQPLTDRLYYALRGAGAWMEAPGGGPAVRLRVSDVGGPDDLAALRMVASKTHREPALDRVRAALGIRDEQNVGSVGLKLGLIARGDRDLYVSLSQHSRRWDACGPEVILVEAGGRLTDCRGALLDYRAADLANRSGLVATNGRAHDAVIAHLSRLVSR